MKNNLHLDSLNRSFIIQFPIAFLIYIFISNSYTFELREILREKKM